MYENRTFADIPLPVLLPDARNANKKKKKKNNNKTNNLGTGPDPWPNAPRDEIARKGDPLIPIYIYIYIFA